jgi:hypothetical protein
MVGAALFVGTFWLHAENAVAVNHNETANGDLSNSGNSPTALSLSAGTNSVTGSLPGSDLDFLTIHVPADHELTALTLASYAGGGDGTSFIGMKNGTTITVTGDPGQLTGYTHFGTGQANVGQNILDDIGRGFGATGFTPPLPAGAYSFWIQQASLASTSYQFDFLVNALAPPGLTGDYNDNGAVDAADYVVWRNSVGGTSLMNRDPLSSGEIDEGDYNSWRANFGSSAGGAAAISAVPEPANIFAVIGAAIFAVVRTRRH